MSVIAQDTNLALQKAGAVARALGRSQFDNPFLKAEAMPAKTGETMEVWNAKCDAWRMGWTIENAMALLYFPNPRGLSK